MDEFWDIYNSKEEKIGKTIRRGEKLHEGEFHLVVHIWIINENQYLIQKRPEHLEWKPGYWATTGGSAIKGESSIKAAIRETNEEVGLLFKQENFELVTKEIKNNEITYVYLVRKKFNIDELVIDTNEVDQIKFVSKEELILLIKNNKFINYGNDYFQKIFAM